jgi:hypothetical protein
MLKCGECGGSMFGSAVWGVDVYRCKYDQRNASEGGCGRTCTASRIEAALFKVFAEHVLTAEREKQIRDRARKLAESERGAESVDALEREAGRLRRKVENAYEAIAEAESKTERDILRRKAAEWQQAVETLQQRIKAAEATIDTAAASAKLVRNLRLSDAWQHAPLKERRAAVEALVARLSVAWRKGDDTGDFHGRAWRGRRLLTVTLRPEIGGQTFVVELAGHKQGRSRIAAVEAVADLYAATGKPVRIRDVADRLGVPRMNAYVVLRTAARNNQLRHLGREGYVPASATVEGKHLNGKGRSVRAKRKAP